MSQLLFTPAYQHNACACLHHAAGNAESDPGAAPGNQSRLAFKREWIFNTHARRL
jgi:hypothetical protein